MNVAGEELGHALSASTGRGPRRRERLQVVSAPVSGANGVKQLLMHRTSEHAQDRPRISVVIPTYNAERTLEQCLASVAWADEVVVVDMFSTDRTLEICERFPNTRVLQRVDYIFANVNFGIDQARNEWIIRHDSDEMITPELRDEILEKLADGSLEQFDGYFIGELINHFGIWTPNGANRNGREKLFRRGCFRYAVQSEHELPTISGRWGTLQNVYLHDSNPSLPYMLRKWVYYAERDAERADVSRPRSPWYIAYRTFKAFASSSVRLRMRNGPMEKGLNPILSMMWAFKYFMEESFAWERSLQLEKQRTDPDPRPVVRDFGSSVTGGDSSAAPRGGDASKASAGVAR